MGISLNKWTGFGSDKEDFQTAPHLFICLCVSPQDRERMLSQQSRRLWVRCEGLARVNRNNSFYSNALIPTLAPGLLCWSTDMGDGTRMGRNRLILLLRWQGELGQGHGQLVYNPVWLAKKKGGDSWWHRPRHGGWMSSRDMGPHLWCSSFFRWDHHGSAFHCSLNKTQTPEHGSPLPVLTLNLAPWAPATLASPHTLITVPHTAGALHTLHSATVRLFPCFPDLTPLSLQVAVHGPFLRRAPLTFTPPHLWIEQCQGQSLCGPHHCCRCIFVCKGIWFTCVSAPRIYTPREQRQCLSLHMVMFPVLST